MKGESSIHEWSSFHPHPHCPLTVEPPDGARTLRLRLPRGYPETTLGDRELGDRKIGMKGEGSIHEWRMVELPPSPSLPPAAAQNPCVRIGPPVAGASPAARATAWARQTLLHTGQTLFTSVYFCSLLFTSVYFSYRADSVHFWAIRYKEPSTIRNRVMQALLRVI